MLQSTLEIMLQTKVGNVLNAPGFPGSTMKLPKPSDSAGTLRGSGKGTNLIGGLLLSSKVNANSYQTSWTKPSKNSFLPLSQGIPLTTNASTRSVIICLAGLKIHHCPLVSQTMILLLDLITILFRRLPISTLILLISTCISHLMLKDHPLQSHRISAIFQPVTLPKLHKIIQSTPNKNCDLDPVPTSLLKQILPSIIPLVADIINSSLRVGIFPESFKRALVRPLLKKPGLELLEGNYRPVSNLGYVSKLMEHVVASQLVNHIDRHGFMEAHQLAYCPFHSTETALLKVKSDVISALEKQEVACLVLLDLSMDFDTINHDIFLGRLKSRFAVTGTTLNWLWSYLTHRTQAVEIGAPLSGGSRSAFVPLESGILQGTVLGAILFTIYTVPIRDICRTHQVEFHLYADDTQIYFSFRAQQTKHET